MGISKDGGGACGKKFPGGNGWMNSEDGCGSKMGSDTSRTGCCSYVNTRNSCEIGDSICEWSTFYFLRISWYLSGYSILNLSKCDNLDKSCPDC